MSMKPDLDSYDHNSAGDNHRTNVTPPGIPTYVAMNNRENKVYPVKVLDPEGNLKFWWSGSVLNVTSDQRLAKSKASRKANGKLHKTAHYTLRGA